MHIKDATSVTCPTCYHPTTLPARGVASLPANVRLSENVHLDSMLERVMSSSPKSVNHVKKRKLLHLHIVLIVKISYAKSAGMPTEEQN